jgi:hypothetical protein
VAVYLQLSLKRWAYFIISSADDSLFLTSPRFMFNPLNAQLKPICHLLALLGAHPILHVSRIRVKYAMWMVEFAQRQDQRSPSN